MSIQRQYSFADKFCLGADHMLRALLDNPKTTGRAYPAQQQPLPSLSPAESKQSAALMRVNHVGEICAQALYHGQAMVSRRIETRDKLEQAAVEEGDHLAWCSQRLTELQSHTSYLNPLWYAGSFLMGVTAGIAGDQWSLGFLAETEKQVVQHLEKHLKQLPQNDQRSQAVLLQMQQDEEQHRDAALGMGAAALPLVVQKWMRWMSRVMVGTAYWV